MKKNFVMHSNYPVIYKKHELQTYSDKRMVLINGVFQRISANKNEINDELIRKFRNEAERDRHYKRESPLAFATLNLRHPITGKEPSCNSATSWIVKYANDGEVHFQCVLGLMYDYGCGVNQDYKQAQVWLNKAVEQGLLCAKTYLGESFFGEAVDTDAEYDGDLFKKAFYWYEQAAEDGDLWAQTLLAEALFEGLGTKVDGERAFFWERKAANQGDMSSQYGVGWCYNAGCGVKKLSIGCVLVRKGCIARIFECAISFRASLFVR